MLRPAFHIFESVSNISEVVVKFVIYFGASSELWAHSVNWSAVARRDTVECRLLGRRSDAL